LEILPMPFGLPLAAAATGTSAAICVLPPAERTRPARITAIPPRQLFRWVEQIHGRGAQPSKKDQRRAPASPAEYAGGIPKRHCRVP
jgi:hypothetical protein